MIGTGRVWATSAISEPSVTTISTPRRSAAPTIASVKVRQRTFGSIPDSSTRSRSAPGDARAQHHVRRPVDVAGLALGEADRRPVDLEVVELLRVDPRERLGLERRPRPPRAPPSPRSRRRSSPRTPRPARASAAAAARPPKSAHRARPPGESIVRAPVQHRRDGSRGRRARSRAGPRHGPRDRVRAAARAAVRGSLRLRAPRPADLAERLDLPGARAPRPHAAPSQARVFREADRIGMRFERGDAVGGRAGRPSATAASSSPSSTTCAGSSPAATTRPSSCPPPTARSTSSRGSSST